MARFQDMHTQVLGTHSPQPHHNDTVADTPLPRYIVSPQQPEGINTAILHRDAIPAPEVLPTHACGTCARGLTKLFGHAYNRGRGMTGWLPTSS